MAEIRVTLCILLLQIITPKVCSAGTVAHSPASTVREVSHEDIRDAILSLVNIYRDNTDKLERHEARERQLGDQLKKSLAQVDRKQRTEESNMVTILDTLNTINRRLEVLENAMANQANQCKDSNNPSSNGQHHLIQKLNSVEQLMKNNDDLLHSVKQNVDQKLDSIVQNVQQTQTTVTLLQQELTQLTVSRNQKDADSFIKLDSKLTEIQPHLEKFDKILELQNTSVQHTTTLLNNVRSSDSIDNADQLFNSTYQLLIGLKLGIENYAGFMKEKIGHTEDILLKEQQTIHKDILNSAKANEDLRVDVAKSYDKLLAEIKGFSKMDQVLIQTADNVLDTKRRIEYGTHQILQEVGELIKSSSKDTNDTINKRFDMISNEIVINQNEALKNLSTKIESEISQVWRQIGIMYQVLTNSANVLDKLQQQTEIYVNGSLGTMDSMEGKVSQITSRMSEVDENLNYLLGRLSLVTQEFSQIKTGLGEALDSIRGSLHTVQDKVKDVGPGPKPIEDDISTADSQLLKTKYSIDNK